jgi:rSAM/selenodomain-associated transferase 1
MAEPRPATEIAVLAKAPIPGLAKTRLIARLGADGAARLQAALTEHAVLTALRAGLGPVTLWCTPHTRHPAFTGLAERTGVALRTQRGGDLGARMAHAVAQHAARGPVLLTGTDCPALTAEHLCSAAAALAEGDEVVLFPAEDGGYVLVGVTASHPALFEGVPWGSDQVMDATRKRLRALGLHWSEPTTLWDLDRPEDLDRLVTTCPGCVPELESATDVTKKTVI